MEHRIVDFTELLRRNGLRVSMAEEIDAFRALTHIGVADRAAMKDTLRAAMVKRAVDLPAYDEIFDLYFSGLGNALRDSSEAARHALELNDAEFQTLMERLAQILEGLEIELSALARALLKDDRGRLQRIIQEAAQRASAGKIEQVFQEGRYGHATAQELGIGALSEELQQMKEQLASAGISADLEAELQRFIDRRQRDLMDMIKRAVRLELEKQDPSLRSSSQLRSLAEKSFYYLSEEEIRRMKEAVTKLAQRLKNIVTIRRRHGKRGRFDSKGTLRTSMQYGGVPFKIRFDHRMREKPRVVVLCDVSDSVRNVSRFMLQFVYSLQDLYSRVRSYIFVSEVGEITRLFEENDIHQAIDQALTGNMINVYAHSDFGAAFRRFHCDHLGALNKRTTVIVLGDARNNYNAPHEWALKEMQQRCKQIIWLNPEARLTWGFGDSEMDRYRPYCRFVEECRNLNQLYHVVDRLVT